MTDSEQRAPDPEIISRYLIRTFQGVDVVEAMGATFFSLDAEKHWPNFATIVTTDEHDEGTPSDLARPGAFRLNIGVGRDTFTRIVGAAEPIDGFAAYDRLLPHPIYSRQRWICILNPSHETFRVVVLPLIAEAHDRLASAQARHGASARSE
jgi:hypothetical protein